MKPECKVEPDGTKMWTLYGKLHREDGPAVESANGTKHWYLNGRRHREDEPAVECADGARYWFTNGHRHREDGPAVEFTSGTKYWFLKGERLYKSDFTSIELIIQLKAFELFTPKELLRLRNEA